MSDDLVKRVADALVEANSKPSSGMFNREQMEEIAARERPHYIRLAKAAIDEAVPASASLIVTLQEQVKKAREALEPLAEQKTSGELDDEGVEDCDADYREGFDRMCEGVRAAIHSLKANGESE